MGVSIVMIWIEMSIFYPLQDDYIHIQSISYTKYFAPLFFNYTPFKLNTHDRSIL